ncbi:hypothetical protein [Methanobacterium sp.]|jgi:hypothetical protein|uniref:hypothetical protein n=1 Tax=Methanobacterium sp. TaxID=2164 RepID=UPI0031593370
MELDENALKLIKKCEDKEVDTSVMGACTVLLEEMDRGKIDLGEDKPDESYIQMAQSIAPEDVPKVLKMAFKIKERPNVSPEMKIAANRLIRAIEQF